ncbi:MAG TPA: hypothetical protein DCF91_01730 [Porphyromonadaceae bacterium]|nr:hypothetical protein [Porphyromonadaceae bacterium]
MKQTSIITYLFALLLLVSCDRDPLYYATKDTATVRFNFDWSGADLSPNGVSAFIYKTNTGGVLRLREISPIAQRIDLDLPVGCYDIIFVNDTEAELDNINFGETYVQNTFKAIATMNVNSKFQTRFGQQEGYFTGESDVLAKAIVRNVEVTVDEVKYHTSRPSLGELVISKEYQVLPTRASNIVNVEIDVENIGSLAGTPLCKLTNMSSGCLMDNNSRLNENVTIEFVLNKRTLDKGNSKKGTLGREFATFGLHDGATKADRSHMLLLHFELINGEDYQVELDVTESIMTLSDDINTIHTIRGKVELPVVIGNGSGPFNPDLEEWEDTEVDLPV